MNTLIRLKCKFDTETVEYDKIFMYDFLGDSEVVIPVEMEFIIQRQDVELLLNGISTTFFPLLLKLSHGCHVLTAACTLKQQKSNHFKYS